MRSGDQARPSCAGVREGVPKTSSRGTLGSQPSSVRARAMSGWRTRGSSTGSGRNTMRLREPVSSMICSASWRIVSSQERPIAVAGTQYRVMSGPLDGIPRPAKGVELSSDELLGRFLDYVAGKGLELYPAQEEAILGLFEGKNVILNTPTGSGKTLVASALHFAALARGRRSVYTSPIKALVNEKWMALCRELGPENVGLSTGDATVNHQAPVLCCTAEVLANMALRDGEKADVYDVVMDEFHWYSDRDRGVAWQVPLLALKQAR